MTRYGLIVCDASPLITLAKAGELDVLLRQHLPIIIPDAVYREATSPNYEDGHAIAAWIIANEHRVRVAVTDAGLQQDVLLRAGAKARQMGEIAAIEVINRFLTATPDDLAVLIYEDSDVRKLPVIERTRTVTTGAFLVALERANLIQSADRILDQASHAGRNVDAQREPTRGEPPGALVAQIASLA